MKIMITGANGQVGWELARQTALADTRAVCLDSTQLDITDAPAVERRFHAEKPDLLINAAAYTRVDQAETETTRAYQVNRDAPGHLAACCAAAGIPMIHISTDYVFDGTQPRPYPESFPLSPIGAYGQSKAAGETLIRQRLAQHLIVRTSWVYGVHGNNFVKTMLRLGTEKKRIGVVGDQQGCPTAAADLAAALLSLARWINHKEPVPWGIYHYSGRNITTWFDFATAVFRCARRFGYPHHPEVTPLTTAEYPTPTRRPAYSALDCTKISQNFGVHPIPWQESLPVVMRELIP